MEATDYAEQREDLLLSIERDRQEVRTAVHELTDAAETGLDLAGRIRKAPLAWALGSFLVGAWLGSRRSPATEIPPRSPR